MEEHQVKRLPVIENHRLVGLISEADLCVDTARRWRRQFTSSAWRG
jgi:CBS domain-containing protein